MKKYPYTDSTDLIIYERKEKKEKKPKTWLIAISSALTASVLTAAVFGAGLYYIYDKNQPSVTQRASAPSAIASEAAQVTQLTETVNGKQVLTIPQIAATVGPSVVGVINKTKVQPQNYFDPFSGRFYYD